MCIFAPDPGEGQTGPHVKNQKLILCSQIPLVNLLVKENAFGKPVYRFTLMSGRRLNREWGAEGAG
jgi:hypothetical protein